MATRPPSHPAVDGDATVSQPGAVSGSVPGRIPFKTDSPTPPSPDPNSPKGRTSSQKAQDFLVLARERWQTIDQHESKLRSEQQDDLDFFASDQWPQSIRQQRERDGRPCLTVNRLPGFVRQLTNEMRDARPGIEVVPVDSGADPALAEVYQGLIQHIEANSDADVAYSRASDAQVRIGRGYFRIVPEYASDTGFEQELRIKSIRNPQTVYFDHASQELDGSDARYAFVVEDIPIPEYDDRFGQATRLSLSEFSRSGESATDWMPEGKVRVAEYYCFVPKTRTIHQLQNGWVLEDDDLKRLEAAAAEQQRRDPQFVPPNITPVRSREVEGRQLTWALINGAAILDGNDEKTGGRELPGRWLPIIPVYGEEIDLDGEIDYRGLIRDSKDAQRMQNFWKSAMTETVALAPKAPFVAEAGQIENNEEDWRTANVKNLAVLKYRAKALDGHLLPAPQRQTAEPPIQAMAMLTLQMENDLRATVGFSYDVGTQEKRVEQSGRAILARQAQGEKGNSHFSAHLAVSLRHAGRILVDLIPSYYDTPRVKRILGRDGVAKQVLLHAGNPEDAMAEAAKQQIAETQIYDLSAGRYDVRVKAGVSYASQRQQDQELVANALQTNPALFQIIGDLFFKTLDSPIAERISQRLKKALPPGLADAEDGQPPPIPPQIQQQMQQMDQLIQALTQRLNEMTEEQQAKREELASKERIAQIQAQTDLAIAQAKIAADQAKLAVETEAQARSEDRQRTADAEESERGRHHDFAEAESDRGVQKAIALLQAQIQAIDQLVRVDMARLQADHETKMAQAQGQAPPQPPAAAPPAPVAGILPAMAPASATPPQPELAG